MLNSVTGMKAISTALILFLSSGLAQSNISRVFVYHNPGYWNHTEGRRGCNEIMAELANEHGFEIHITEDASEVRPATLKDYQLFIGNNNNDYTVAMDNPGARDALQEFLENGGGFIAIHGSGDHRDNWDWYNEVMGTKFISHSSQEPGVISFDNEALDDDELNMAVGHLDLSQSITGEWYSYDRNVRGSEGMKVIMTIDEDTFSPNPTMGADHPMIWTHEVGQGRYVYMGQGHRADAWTQKDGYQKEILWGLMQYAARDFQGTPGCMDSNYEEYNPDATRDDGSCMNVGVAVTRSKDTNTKAPAGWHGTIIRTHHGSSLTFRLVNGKLVKSPPLFLD
jgi:type 1 glutamine amidotransferase